MSGGHAEWLPEPDAFVSNGVSNQSEIADR
jgi:hypothetical protein